MARYSLSCLSWIMSVNFSHHHHEWYFIHSWWISCECLGYKTCYPLSLICPHSSWTMNAYFLHHSRWMIYYSFIWISRECLGHMFKMELRLATEPALIYKYCELIGEDVGEANGGGYACWIRDESIRRCHREYHRQGKMITLKYFSAISCLLTGSVWRNLNGFILDLWRSWYKTWWEDRPRRMDKPCSSTSFPFEEYDSSLSQVSYLSLLHIHLSYVISNQKC